ncbi:MAG: NAD(+) diphosphatase [Eubacterium sp.]|nr:NAD(+) diphosphatase [Eubacterium sp.]
MIQDIAPNVFHNEFHDRQPQAHEHVLMYRGDQALIGYDEEGRLIYPTIDQFAGRDISYTYLFAVDNTEYFLGDLKEDYIPEGFSYENMFVFRKTRPMNRAFAGVTGHSLYEWYEGHTYCGRCGTPTEKDHKERMVRCPKCGLMNYPRISPAVIVAVTHNGKILMSKYAGRGYTRFALLAGFAEIGETIEQTVHREVMEEVGVRVKNLRFYKSQPWPFSSSLLMGFFCDLDGDEETLTLDHEELSMAGWYTPEEVPEDDEISLTREMMQMFKKGTYPR